MVTTFKAGILMRWNLKSKQCLSAALLYSVILLGCKHETVAITPYPDNDGEYVYTGSYEPQAYAPPPPMPAIRQQPQQSYDSYSYGIGGSDNDSGYYYGYTAEPQDYASPPPPPPPQAYPDYDEAYYYGATTDAAEHQPYAAPSPAPQQPPPARQAAGRSLRPYDYNTDEDGNVTHKDNDSAYYPLYYYE